MVWACVKCSPQSAEGRAGNAGDSVGRVRFRRPASAVAFCSEMKKAKNDERDFCGDSAPATKSRMMEKSVWQLPFHARGPVRLTNPVEAFQCLRRGRRATARIISKKMNRASNFLDGRESERPRSPRAVGWRGGRRGRFSCGRIESGGLYSMRSSRWPSFSFFVRR